MLKSKFSLSRHFEYANEQITYHFWLCRLSGIRTHNFNGDRALIALVSLVDLNPTIIRSRPRQPRQKNILVCAMKFRPKSTFLTIPILIAGTNSVSSGNIVEESFFDKIVADKLKVPTII
jgi:hypothetical protein